MCFQKLIKDLILFGVSTKHKKFKNSLKKLYYTAHKSSWSSLKGFYIPSQCPKFLPQARCALEHLYVFVSKFLLHLRKTHQLYE